MLLALAFVPTVSSFYRGLPEMSEQISTSMPESLLGMTGTPTPRKAAEIRNEFGTRDWMERVYRAQKGVPITLFIVRGYDCRPFFHMPEYALLDRGWSKRKHAVEHWMLDEGRTDIHVLELTGLKFERKVYYALLYKDKTIGNPYWFLVRNLPEMLLAKRKPYTLIFLSYPVDANENAADEGARKLLASSLRQMLRRHSETPEMRFQLPEAAHRAAAHD